MTRVLDEFQEEYHLSMLQDNMTIDRLIVLPQQVEDARAKRNIDAQRERSFDDGFSKCRLEIQDKPRFE